MRIVYRHSFEKRYYLKASPWSSRQRTIPSRKLALIFASVILLLSGLTAFFLTKHNSKTKAEAFSLELTPAPLNTNYLYLSANQPFKIYLGDRLQENKPKVRFEFDGSSADFSLNQISNQNTQVEKLDNKSIIYKNVFSGIDIKYYLTEKGIKEEVILSNQQSAISNQQFTFALNLKNAVPRKSLEGQISAYFIDPQDGQYRFHIPQPFMVDAAGARSTEVELQLVKQSDLEGSTSYQIILIPSQEWLNHPARQYPVIIDPSVVHDTSSEFATGTFNRIEDAGSGTSPKLRLPYHELPADIHTVGLWHLNETTSGNAQDSSGNGNHQTTGSTSNITTTGQKLGAAARTFDGSSNYIRIPDSASLYSNTLTAEAWVKPDSAALASGKVAGIVDHRITLNQWQLTLSSGTLGWAAWDSGGSLVFNIWTSTTLEANKWSHVAGTSDGATVRLYINGELVSSGAVSGIIGDVSTAVTIGKNADNAARYFSGTIDEVRISNVARTAEEIRQDAQRFPYGVYTSDSIDLTGGTSTVASLDSISWTESITPPSAPSGWTKVKPVIIDNTQNSNTLTNYQVKVNVDYDSNMQADFDDLKFTNTSGTNLDYWIEEKADGAWAKVWVEVDSISASALTTIFMWYGNAGASAGSNGSNTFVFFDDFSTDTSGNYVVVSAGTKVYDTTNKVLKQTDTTAAQHWIVSTVDTLPNAYVYQADVKIVNDPPNRNHSGLATDFSTSAVTGYRLTHLDAIFPVSRWSAGSETSIGSFSDGGIYADNKWLTERVYRNRTSGLLKYEATDGTTTVSGEYTDTTHTTGHLGFHSYGSEAWYDNVRVRNYIPPEPVAGVGADIEFQTRTGSTSSPPSGWEAWRPITAETAIASMDSDATNWSTSSTAMLTKTDESTIKMEGAGSLKSTVGAPQTDANTAALWHLEETSGTGAYIKDSTANANHGTPTGTTVVDGFYGKARSFDGSSNWISVGNPASLQITGQLTLEAWVNTSASIAYRGIISKMGTGGGQYGYLLRESASNGYAEFGVSSNGTAWTNVLGTTAINDGKWHHLAGVYTPSTKLEIYIDGVLQNINSTSIPASIYNTAGGFSIGSTYTTPSEMFSGIIDEARVSNIARTAEEIAEAYRAGRDHRLQRTISSTDLSSKTKVPFYFAGDKQGTIAETYVGETDYSVYGTDANTKGLWHLEENFDYKNSIKDSSGNGNDGALAGFKLNTFESGVDGWSYRDGNWATPAQDCTTAAVGSCSVKMTDTDGGAGSNYITTTSYSSNNTKFDLWYKCESGALWGFMVYNGSTWSCIKGSGTTGCGASYNPIGSLTPSVVCDNTWRQATYNLGTGWSGQTISQTIVGDWDAQAANKWMWFDQFQIYQTKPTFTQGKIGGARNFDGTDDYISVADSSSLDLTTASTLETWIYFTGTFNATQNSVLEKAYWTSGADNGGYQLIVDNGTSGNVGCAVANNDWDYLGSNSTLTTNTWYHLACTFNGSTLKIYINGKEDNSVATSVSSIKNISQTFNIGSTSAGTYNFPGMIDEARVSNTARSADDIRLAYQYGLRTHQINVDFVDSLNSADLITGSSDTSFTLNNAENLYKYDKVIVKENYNGTFYYAQGEVASKSGNNIAVSSWDAGSTFPSGGYTVNATVLKWQREYWDIGDISPADRNATVRLGLRVLDASEGFVMYLDDFRHNTNYLTDPSGSTPTSTANRYIQYRAILSTNDTLVTPQLTSVTINYTINNRPNTPSLNSPTDTATKVSLTPALQTTATDTESDYLRYKIELCTNQEMTENCQTFDQTSSQTGWSGQNAEGGTAYTSGIQATYTVQSALSAGTTYFWRSYAIDQGGSNIWSATQSPVYSFTTTYLPTAPTSLLAEGQTNPSGVTDTTPEFSAIYNDPDSGDIANKYRIQVDDDSGFGTPIWDSGASGTSMTNCNVGTRCQDISYGGASTDLQWGTTYYWQIKYWDQAGAEGAWSTESAYFTMVFFAPPTGCHMDDGSQPGEITVKWQDNTSLETGYRIEKNTDGGGFVFLTNKAVDSTSHLDNTTSANHTYQYRIRAESNNGNSDWCGTTPADLSEGNFKFEGVRMEGVKIE